MVSVEKALGDSLELYKKSPQLIVPHTVELFLDIGVYISMALTILMAIGVHVTEVALSDPELLMSQIMSGGLGLIFIILLTLLFSFFLISLFKAGSVAGVVAMAEAGFRGGRPTLAAGWEGAKKHTLPIFLFWIMVWLLSILIPLTALIPVAFAAILGLSETAAAAITLFALLTASAAALIFYATVMFAPQYMVVSDAGVTGSIKKSIDFVRRNKASVAVYIAVAVVFFFFFFLFISLLSIIPEILSETSPFLSIFTSLLINLLSMVTSLL
ncbi:MAG: hypothetical protein D6733_04910, partial [Methanobacteriota archaeon]